MARFGLDSDSDSDRESLASSVSSASTSSSSSSPRNHTRDQRQHDSDEEEAPPRQSLYDHSHDEDQESGADSQDDDQMTSSRSRSRSRSRSGSVQSTAPSLSVSMSPRPRQRQPHSLPASRPQAPRWAANTTAAARPARTAVMQASLFGPSPADHALLQQQQDQDGDESADGQDYPSTKSPVERLPQRGTKSTQEKGKQPETTPTAPQETQQRPLRPFSLVPLADSCANGHEGSLADASLALGRSYRVGFGPQGQVVSLRGGAHNKPGPVQAGKLHVDRLQLVASGSAAKRDAIRLLELQLAKSDIYEPSPNCPVPQAVPSEALRFHHFAGLFHGSRDADGGSDEEEAGQADRSRTDEEARLFRLGSCLFDEIVDLALDQVEDPAAQSYVQALRRRRLVSSWFEDAASTAVEADLGPLPAPSPASPAASAKRIFALLSGHQVSAACDAAIESGNLRLATILAQVGPDALATDDAVRADVALQLEKWREYHIDSFVDDAYRKVLEVVSGNLGVSQGRQDLDPKGDSVNELHVLEGLGWKRALAAGAWYAAPRVTGAAVAGADAGLAEVVDRYEQAYRADPRVAAPAPSYLPHSASYAEPSTTAAAAEGNSLPWPPASSSSGSGPGPLDPAFHLLKLFTSPTHPLEAALEPRNFGPSPLDYRLPWHLYMLLSRVLQQRDWEDRLEVVSDEAAGREDDEDAAMMVRAENGDDEAEVVLTREGNSVTADRVTEAYAMQLEALGEWHWAAFVLLHIELPDRRVKAIRELLARHIEELELAAQAKNEEEEEEEEGIRDEEQDRGPKQKVEFLVNTLKIPDVWIYSARADYHLASPHKVFRAYTLLLAANRASEAHRIATEDLVPEALVRSDYALVRRFLEPFLLDSPESATGEEPNLEGGVPGWKEGGRTYLLFLSQPDHPHLLAKAMQAVQALARRVNESNRLRGKKLLRLAVAEMESRLTVLAKADTASKALERTQPSLLMTSDRAVWIQGANQAFWQSAVAAATSVRA
ncbi:hypothetical protein JCM3774_006288 [Rhodotorula dairenensis]